MFISTDDERFISIETPESPSTKRWIYVSYLIASERKVYYRRKTSLSSFRTVYVDVAFGVSEVTCIFSSYYATESTNRYVIIPEPTALTDSRFCFYVPGAEVILSNFSVSSIVTYGSNRFIVVEDSEASQIQIYLSYTITSERQVSVFIESELGYFTLDLHSQMSFFDERQTFVGSGDYCQRQIVLVYEDYTEVQVSYQAAQEITLNSIVTHSSLGSISGERTCICCGIVSHSERTYMSFGSSITERFVHQTFRIFDERLCCTILNTKRFVHAFSIVPATPKYYEILNFFEIIEYKTEVYCYAEIRDLYVSKFPGSIPNDLVVKSSSDSHSNIGLSSDRHLEEGTNSADQEIRRDLLSQKSIISTELSSLSLSNTDTKGGKVSIDEDIVKTLVGGGFFTLDLNVRILKFLGVNWHILTTKQISTSWRIIG